MSAQGNSGCGAASEGLEQVQGSSSIETEILTSLHSKEQLGGASIGPILEGLSDGILAVDREYRITAFNRVAEQITGMPRARVIGQNCAAVFRSQLCRTSCLMRRVMESNTPLLGRCTSIVNASGLYIPIRISAYPVRNQDGTVLYGLETFQDLRLEAACPRNKEGQTLSDVLVTRNQRMGRIVTLLPQIAGRNCKVLIEGERGTGKERMAWAIHALSPRKQKPFTVLNCQPPGDKICADKISANESPALRTNLSHKATRGIVIAPGSTLFLKRLDAAGRAFQEYLRQALRETIARSTESDVGQGNDVRIISSALGCLADLVHSGAFLRDLYSELRSIRLVLPPLRERKEDIPLLVEKFISSFNRMRGKSVQGVRPDALAILLEYNYPGNISELKSIIAQAFNACAHGYIAPLDLPAICTGGHPATADQYSMEMVVQTAEEQAILAALRRNRYHRQDAARELGIHKSTFFRKVKRLGITLPAWDGRFREDGN